VQIKGLIPFMSAMVHPNAFLFVITYLPYVH
jgi:hypothetical protein